MATRSPRSPAVCEVYESDCAMGLVKILRSGHCWPGRKQPSNGRVDNRNPDGTGNSKKALFFQDIGGNKTPTANAGKASLQKVREDISTSHGHHLKRHAAAVDVQCAFKPSRNVLKKIVCQKGYPTPGHDNKHRVMAGKFGNQSCSNDGRECSGKRKKLNLENFEELSEINLQRFGMTEASKTFAGRKFFKEEDLWNNGASYQSKQFIDALMILKSNKEMFLKLVQDPNFILAEQVHSHGIEGGRKSKIEAKFSDFRKLEKTDKHEFFWKKIESGPKGDSKSQTSDKTLLFPPVLTSIQHSVSRSSCSRPPTLPFGNVRKKSKHYVGDHEEEQHRRIMEASSGSHKTLDNLQVSGDGKGRLGAESEWAMDWKQREPDIYVEAKKHISKVLATRGKDEGYSRKLITRPLEKILSLPSYDVSSKRCCRREIDHNFIHQQLSFPHFNSFTMVNSSQISRAMLCDEVGNQEQSIWDFPCKYLPSAYSLGFSSPSNSSVEYPEEYLNHFKDKLERPSPVSVLEPILPSRTTTKPVSKLPIQPSRTNFDEHCPAIVISPCSPMISSSSSMKESGLTYEHLRGILLDKSLFDEAKLFLAQSCNDHKLLHDCISEVFLEVYLHEFKCSSWITDIQPMKRMSVMVQKHVIEKVIKAIDCGLRLQTPPPTLEQLLAKDFAKPGAWMVVQADTENVVVEMAEDILTELIKELV